MIDAHVHFWKFDKVKDAWITDDMKVIQKDFLPRDLKPILSENNLSGVVAVQADQSENETEFLLSLSRQFSFIKGIVAWVDLQNKNVEERLLHYSKEPVIKGFRHIVQSEVAGFLKRENFLNGIRSLQKFNFTYDLLIYENQLDEAVEFVNQFPDLPLIIDHCAKPAIKNKSIVDWKKWMKEISKNENVYCKLSGLITEAKWNEWTEEDLHPYFDTVFEYFGTDRIVFGSDWPVMLLSGNYAGWRGVVEKYLARFPQTERDNVFSKNAIKFYKLNS
ncbi:MAG: amidohydrolase family protein [Ginsengibacter sp.]